MTSLEMSDRFGDLLEGFAFDCWANTKWWEYLQSATPDEVSLGIFRHMLVGQEVWNQRVIGNTLTDWPQVEPSEENLHRLNQAWVDHLTQRQDDPIIHYHRFDGVAGHLHLSQIARHIIDHGTYHRGELRGLCRNQNIEDFPETGLALYYMTNGA